jgi:hypothetical protein
MEDKFYLPKSIIDFMEILHITKEELYNCYKLLELFLSKSFDYYSLQREDNKINKYYYKSVLDILVLHNILIPFDTKNNYFTAYDPTLFDITDKKKSYIGKIVPIQYCFNLDIDINCPVYEIIYNRTKKSINYNYIINIPKNITSISKKIRKNIEEKSFLDIQEIIVDKKVELDIFNYIKNISCKVLNIEEVENPIPILYFGKSIQKINEVIKLKTSFFNIKNELEFQTLKDIKDNSINEYHNLNRDIIKEIVCKYTDIKLLLYKDKYYLENPTLFIKIKKYDACKSYYRNLVKLYTKDYTINNFKRNDTNNRLDTPFTNLPKLIKKNCSTKEDELLTIDLKSSQFCLTQLLVKHLPCYKKYSSIFNEDFYNYTGKLFFDNYDECMRNTTKNIDIKIFFASPIYNDKYKRILLNSEIGDVFRFQDELKRKNKDSKGYVAVELQKKEASIFIDGMLTELMNNKIWALSIHDSISFKKKDLQKVKEIFKKHMDEQGIIWKWNEIE